MSYKCGTVFLKPEWMLLLEMQPLQERPRVIYHVAWVEEGGQDDRRPRTNREKWAYPICLMGVGSQEKTKIDWEEPKYYRQRSICLKER